MGAVYTKLLGEGYVAAGDVVVVFTAPTVGVVVVRDITIAPHDGTGGPVSVDTGSGSNWLPIWRVRMVDGFTSLQWQGREVLVPGEQLRVVTLDGDCQYRVTGYLLGT